MGVDILPKMESLECEVECIHAKPCPQVIPVECKQAPLGTGVPNSRFEKSIE